MAAQVKASTRQKSTQKCDELILSLNNNNYITTIDIIMTHIEFLSCETIFNLMSNENILLCDKKRIIYICEFNQINEIYNMFTGNEPMQTLIFENILKNYKQTTWILKEHLKEEIMCSGNLREELKEINNKQIKH